MGRTIGRKFEALQRSNGIFPQNESDSHYSPAFLFLLLLYYILRLSHSLSLSLSLSLIVYGLPGLSRRCKALFFYCTFCRMSSIILIGFLVYFGGQQTTAEGLAA
jgi:hypothetical protein